MVNEEGRLSSTVVEMVPTLEHQRLLHQTIKKVTEDIEALRFNTAISQMMVFTNEMTKAGQRSRALLEPFVLILAPFAPHLAEELWEMLGHRPSVSQQPWPIFDPVLTVSDRLTIPIQVNGKLRAKLDVGRAPRAGRRAGSCSNRGVAHGKEPRRLCRKKTDELCRQGSAEC
jgi:leucyl-tRNA synthetase